MAFGTRFNRGGWSDDNRGITLLPIAVHVSPRYDRHMTENSNVDQLVTENLALAQIIAFEYGNIPGIVFDDAVSDAQQALHRAVVAHDPVKGPLEPFAARAIRNALNSLYRKQMRTAKMFPESLDRASHSNPDEYLGKEPPIARVADPKTNVLLEIRGRESNRVLEAALCELSPRERLVIESIKQGNSLQQIGDKMKITKQGVHKIVKPAMAKLRSRLSQMGYQGVDSKGFLRAKTRKSSKGASGVDDFQAHS